MRIGIVYDRIADYAHAEGPADRFAEFEPETTIKSMEEAIRLTGHQPVRIGSPPRLLDARPDVDLVWNIGEGYGSRNREAWAPVLCEMHGIPYLGSDAYALTVTLDKVLTKQIARVLDIPTTDCQVIPYCEASRHDPVSAPVAFPGSGSGSGSGPGPGSGSGSGSGSVPDSRSIPVPDPILPFPQFLKPRYEGTSKGITEKSVVHTPDEFRSRCRYLLETYRQDVLAEPFLSGAELTCALAGHPLQALPVMERGLHSSGIGSHAVDNSHHLQSLTGETGRNPDSDSDIHVTGAITPELEADITKWSHRLCGELGIRDFVRIDFKLTGDGRPMFLEANPLPTFGIDSTFAILAEIRGEPYPAFLSGILSAAIRRLKL